MNTKNKKIYDLTQTICEGMSLFPGTTPPDQQVISRIETHGYNEHSMRFTSHTGTHMDAPNHLISKGKRLDQYALEHFIGRGFCIPLSGKKDIADWHILTYKQEISQADFILFYTGHDRYWGSEKYSQRFPVIDPEAARLLCTFNIRGVGIDTLSPDPVASQELPSHHILMKYQIVIIENLTNLQPLIEKHFAFYTIPLKTNSADGAPVRAFAIC